MTLDLVTNNSHKVYFPNCRETKEPILLLQGKFDVELAIRQIKCAPLLWNMYTARRDLYSGPHKQMSDIWVRYNDWNNYNGNMDEFNAEHVSVWYPGAYKIPAVIALSIDVFEYVGGKQLGAVLVTKIPPGGAVAPHIDGGWHASYYEKFAVQLKGNKDQAFCFHDYSLSALPGELYTFDNTRTHWVENNSDEERMTLIICIRR